MATNTEHYNLVKPDKNENYDVAIQNGNMDIIDSALGDNAKQIADLEYQNPTIVGTQIQLVRQCTTKTLKFYLSDDISGSITVSLDAGSTSVALKDYDGNQLTLISKGYQEVIDNTTFFTYAPKGAAKLNVYTQITEPTKKEGIWIKTSNPKTKIVNDLTLWFANEWNNPALKTYVPIPAVRSVYGLCSNGNKIYLAGGVAATGTTSALTTFYCYDTELDSWSALTPLPASRALFKLVCVDNKIYAIGGCTTGNGSGTNTNYCYDINTNAWSTLAVLPSTRDYYGMTAVGRKIYLIGGWLSGEVSTNYCYDIDADAWSTLAPLPIALRHFDCLPIGTNIHVVGGYTGSTIKNTHYVYDIANDVWGTLPVIPTATNGYAGASIDSKLYVFGGVGTSYNNCYCYNSIDQTWTLLQANPNYRYSNSMAFANNKLYIFGGQVSTTVYGDVFAYAFTSKEFATGTIILYRINDQVGVYKTELVTPSKVIEGVNTRMTTCFDNVYFYDTTLQSNLPTYYGNGTSWVQFKGF